MSKSYWNEYSKFTIDSSVLKNSLQFYQTTLKNRGTDKEIFTIEQLKTLYNWDTLTFSDVNKQKFTLNSLNKDLKSIVNNILDLYSNTYPIITMPILFVNTETYNVPAGFYSINLEEKAIILYKHYSMKNTDDSSSCLDLSNFRLSLYLFVNIEDAIGFYKNKGLIRGIEQVGSIIKSIKPLNNIMEIRSVELIEQYETHFLGINIRKSLLIDNIFYM